MEADPRRADLSRFGVIHIRVAGHAKQLQDREHRPRGGITLVEVFQAERPRLDGARSATRAASGSFPSSSNRECTARCCAGFEEVQAVRRLSTAADAHLKVAGADVQARQELDFAAQVDDAIEMQGSSSGALRGEADDSFEQGAKVIQLLRRAHLPQSVLYEGDEIRIDMLASLRICRAGADHADQGQIPREARLVGTTGSSVPRCRSA